MSNWGVFWETNLPPNLSSWNAQAGLETICNVQLFSMNQPLGWFSLEVAMSLYVSVCLFVPPQNFKP